MKITFELPELNITVYSKSGRDPPLKGYCINAGYLHSTWNRWYNEYNPHPVLDGGFFDFLTRGEQMEFSDVYDGRLQKTGRLHKRSEQIADNNYKRAGQIADNNYHLVVHKRDGKEKHSLTTI